MKTNCENCGAPYNEQGKCEYCGTIRAQTGEPIISRMVIDANGIYLTTEITKALSNQRRYQMIPPG